MPGPTNYSFEWDPAKAKANLSKHAVSFQLATSVLRDPLAVTIYDEGHSERDERWVTIGQATNGQILVVVHTFEWTTEQDARIRIISARKADRHELTDYENVPR